MNKIPKHVKILSALYGELEYAVANDNKHQITKQLSYDGEVFDVSVYPNSNGVVKHASSGFVKCFGPDMSDVTAFVAHIMCKIEQCGFVD